MTDTIDTVAPASDAASSSLGVGMSHRARPQTVLAQRWSSAGSVGAVGRASVGFGLAVGRSRAIRPTVCFDDLNSAALRPSIHAWNLRHGDVEPESGHSAEAQFGDVAAGTSTSSAMNRAGESTPTRHRSAAPEQRGARTPNVPSARRRMPASPRPTWTDQVIQRSAIGYTSPPITSMPTTAVPDDFVPFGDAKVDQLRLLVMRQEALERGEAAPEQAKNDAPTARSEPARTSRVTETGGRRGDTAAGRSTGPGQFARSMRPEPVGDGGVPVTSRSMPTSRGAPSPGSSLPGSSLPGTPSPRSAGPGVVRRQPTTRSAAPPDKMAALRAMLVEQGIIESDSDEPQGGVAEAGREPAPGRDARSERSRPVVADRGSPAASGERRSDTSATLRRAAQPQATPHDRGLASRPAPVDPTRTTDSSADSTEWPTPPQRPPQAAPVAPTTPPAPWADGRAASPGSSDADFVRHTPTARTDRPGPTAALGQQLRAQRLLSTGLAPIARGLAEAEAAAVEGSPHRQPGTTLLREHDVSAQSDEVLTRGRTGVHEQLPVGASPVTTSASIETHQPEPTPVTTITGRYTDQVARDRSTPVHPHLPNPLGPLDERRAAPNDVLRRVTLPRALSTTHRPPAILSSDERPLAQRASTTTSADHRRSAHAADGESSSVAPRHLIAGRAVPLLDVVRRASAGVVTSPVAAHPEPDRRTIGTAPVIAPTAATVVASGTAPAVGTASTAVRTPAERSADVRALIENSPVAPVRRSVSVDGPSAAPAAATAPTTAPTTAPDSAAPPVERPAERIAAQFMTELSRTVRSRPAPLPASFRPLADSIAGPRPVMLSTDTASRRALRSVGKVAATTGDTIHLDRSAIPGAKLTEVMAHELTHIAAPSPAPRFFDDIDDSPEERRAERIGRVMGRSPLAPSASVVAPTTGSRSSVVRRMPARTSAPATGPSSPQARSAAPTVSAAALAASIGNRSQSSGSSSPVIRRWESGPTPDTSTPRSDVASARAQGYSLDGDADAAAWFEKQLQAQLQPLLRMIEDRMIVELERRGGRTWRMT